MVMLERLERSLSFLFSFSSSLSSFSVSFSVSFFSVFSRLLSARAGARRCSPAAVLQRLGCCPQRRAVPALVPAGGGSERLSMARA
jgi:hypothetical protein